MCLRIDVQKRLDFRVLASMHGHARCASSRSVGEPPTLAPTGRQGRELGYFEKTGNIYTDLAAGFPDSDEALGYRTLGKAYVEDLANTFGCEVLRTEVVGRCGKAERHFGSAQSSIALVPGSARWGATSPRFKRKMPKTRYWSPQRVVASNS